MAAKYMFYSTKFYQDTSKIQGLWNQDVKVLFFQSNSLILVASVYTVSTPFNTQLASFLAELIYCSFFKNKYNDFNCILALMLVFLSLYANQIFIVLLPDDIMLRSRVPKYHAKSLI